MLSNGVARARCGASALLVEQHCASTRAHIVVRKRASDGAHHDGKQREWGEPSQMQAWHSQAGHAHISHWLVPLQAQWLNLKGITFLCRVHTLTWGSSSARAQLGLPL